MDDMAMKSGGGDLSVEDAARLDEIFAVFGVDEEKKGKVRQSLGSFSPFQREANLLNLQMVSL